MTHEFGAHLYSFALSVDSVNDQVFDDVKQLTARYFTEALGSNFFEVLIDGYRVAPAGTPMPALGPGWSSSEHRMTIPIFEAENVYSGFRTFAYHTNKPLWVVHAKGEPLAAAAHPDELQDLWSESDQLPAYTNTDNPSARTSIVIPLKYGGRVFGVVNIEFPSLATPLEAAKSELARLAEALGRIFWLHETTRTQSSDTRKAFELLQERCERGREFSHQESPFTTPTAFVAASNRAADDVLGVLLDLLDEFGDKIQPKFWRDMSDAGAITPQIIKAVSNCSFGICYLSEPAEEEGSPCPYRDNPNVLFEAGMLHAYKRESDGMASRWIPIRKSEDLSGRVPFDFAHERMVIVPRNREQQLQKESFHDGLKGMIDRLL